MCGDFMFRVEPLEGRVLLASDVVLDWNQVMIDALRADYTKPGPTWASRTAAMVHMAVFDAVNGVERAWEPCAVKAKAPRGASAEAAAAAAAWRVLSGLYPQQQAMFDQALAESLAQVPDGKAEKHGVKFGTQVGDAILRKRRFDGSHKVVQYTPGTEAGQWRPTPPDFMAALDPGWGKVKPFAMSSGNQFRPPPPPELTSQEYADAYNQVKELGRVDSTLRTDEMVEIGLFWAYDHPGLGSPVVMYNQMARVIAQQEGNTMLENARLFALLNVSLGDAGIAAWDSKYHDNFWRPVTGIQQGDDDGNPDTVGEATWMPLGAPGGAWPDFTPSFPAYVSGHSTFGAATVAVLQHFYGRDDIHYSLTSDELPGVVRNYTSLSQAAWENGMSRIYLGIHWQFDNTWGQVTGVKVAQYVIENMMLPRKAAMASPPGPAAELTTVVSPGALPELMLIVQDAGESLPLERNLLELVQDDGSLLG